MTNAAVQNNFGGTYLGGVCKKSPIPVTLESDNLPKNAPDLPYDAE